MGLFDWLSRGGPNQFEMTETMWGYMSPGAESAQVGYQDGKRNGNRLEYAVTMHVENFKEFKAPSGRRAPMTGWVTCKNLFGEKLPIRNGEYGLYVVDRQTGQRRITYEFDFTGNDGVEYHFSGYKVIVSEPWTADLLEDQTTLYSEIRTAAGPGGSVYARGIIHYHVEDFPEMLFSLRTPDDDTIPNRLIMARKFFSFVSKEIGEYFQEVNPLYTAEYSNLVVSGSAEAGGGDVEFLLFSGAHDRGFPWGDNVSFWDVGLALRSGATWRRFALSERAIENLELKISEGVLTYEGPLHEIVEGYQVSFTDMHEEPLPGHLRRVVAKLGLTFQTEEVEIRNIPFTIDQEKLKGLHPDIRKQIEKSGFLKYLKSKQGELAGLGYTTRIHRLTRVEGSLVLGGVSYSMKAGRTLGEAEFGTIVGLRQPRLYYNYFCALEPEADLFRIQVRSGVLRTLSRNPLTAESENLMGEVIGQGSRMDLLIKGNEKEEIQADEAEWLLSPDEDILEINNDHFPTATFQRRIVAMPGVVGPKALALEEDMSVIDVSSINSTQTSTVAAIKDPDRFRALDEVLQLTGFFELLERAQLDSGKAKENFAIVVKPNFSFMYSLCDISSFTDPGLIEHFIDRIYERGYRNIAIAEAQSTYTTFYTNRDVPTLARYIGLKGKHYNVVDLSEGVVPHDYGRTLGSHEAHPAWRDADFRISFAKNKTHSYAYYTLTIKNIYGALPKKNKFKEYHCNKNLGIFVPTIDFIQEFPIHFGLIDGYASADGPFGIFADTEPNFTHTIIGGDSIVAVDWVGASKMGYDPMISKYMELAVARFGKPEIRLVGDHSTYSEWKNVPSIISRIAFDTMDRDFLFGDFLYSIMGTMDPFFSFTPDEAGRKVARFFTRPLRKVLFEWRTGGKDKLTWDDLKAMLKPEEREYMEKLVRSLFE